MTERSRKWVRVSTGGQDEASQVPDLDKWDHDHGYVDDGEDYVVHGQSAYHGKHAPKLDEMFEDMASGVFDVLVVWAVDRIERRGALKVFELMERARTAGGRIEFVKDAHLNSANDMSDVMLALSATMAKQESKRKGERTVAKQDNLRSKNALTGTCPWGYEVVTVDGVKTIAPTEIGRTWLPVIFRMVADGETLAAVAHHLTEHGVPSSTRGSKHDNPCSWYPRTIGGIVRNATYAGMKPNGRGHVLRVPAVVTHADFLAANDSLSRRPKRGAPRPDGRAMLAGVLFCPNCDNSPMYRSHGRPGKDYDYYRCTGRGDVTGRKGCGNNLDLGSVNALVNELMSELEGHKVTLHRVSDDTDARIAELRITRRQLDDDADDYDERHAALTAEIKALTARKAAGPEYTVEESGESYAALWQRLETTGQRNDWLRAEGIKVYAARDRKAVTRKVHALTKGMRLTDYQHVAVGYGDAANVVIAYGPDVH
jgi:DNA invertase Pin-like site-specific DNA recombinase